MFVVSATFSHTRHMLGIHPFTRPLQDTARVGFYNENGVTQEDEIGVQSTFAHPSYDSATFDYGFLIVKLDQSSSKPFPTLNSDVGVPDSTSPLYVMGTGNRKPSGLGTRRNFLDEASLELISKEDCEAARGKGEFTYSGLITDTMLCAGTENFGSCEVSVVGRRRYVADSKAHRGLNLVAA